MARAIDRIDRFRWTGTAGGFDGWLFGILRNVVLESYRAGARHRVVDIDFAGEPATDDALDPAAGLLADEDARALRAAFDRLSDDDQEILELRVVAGLPSDAAAAALGRRPGAVRMAQARALTRLRTFVLEEAW